MYAVLICGERGLMFYKVSFYKQKMILKDGTSFSRLT